MSALAEMDLRAVRAVAEVASVHDDTLRRAVAAMFWAWFRLNAERRLKVRVWIFRPSVKVAALAELFTWLFGPDPRASGGGAS